MSLSQYVVEYYRHSWNGRAPAKEYLLDLSKEERLKIGSALQFLVESRGYLNEPQSKKVVGTKFRELIVDCGNLGHRIFYFLTVGQRIILLHAFLKKTSRTPRHEIERGISYYEDFIQS